MKIALVEMGFNSLSHYDLVLQAMRIPDANAAVDEEWEKLEKLPAWQITERAKNSPVCYADGHLSSQECGVSTEISEIQGPSCAPR